MVSNLNAKSKAIIRRDFHIENFRVAYRTYAISNLLFVFAKKHMPEEFAAIENQYNEIYEKQHKRLEERMAQLVSTQQPEEKSETPETFEVSNPEEAVVDIPETAPQMKSRLSVPILTERCRRKWPTAAKKLQL